MRLDLHTHGVRVGAVHPGHVEETEFALVRFEGDAQRAAIYDDFQPLTARDVANAIHFLVTTPPHVGIHEIVLAGTQQAAATVVDRSGRHVATSATLPTESLAVPLEPIVVE